MPRRGVPPPPLFTGGARRRTPGRRRRRSDARPVQQRGHGQLGSLLLVHAAAARVAGNRCATTGCRFHGARTATPSPRIISGRRWRGARGRPWEGHVAAGPNPGSREARGPSPPREGGSRPLRLGPGSRGGARRSPATGCSSRQSPPFTRPWPCRAQGRRATSPSERSGARHVKQRASPPPTTATTAGAPEKGGATRPPVAEATPPPPRSPIGTPSTPNSEMGHVDRRANRPTDFLRDNLSARPNSWHWPTLERS